MKILTIKTAKVKYHRVLMMKIAVALFGTRVSPRFDCAAAFRVVETDNGQILDSKDVSVEKLREMLKEREAVVYADDASDEDHAVRMAVVGMLSIRDMINRIENGDDLTPVAELQGIKLGPLEFLAGPFEIMQKIKNDITADAKAEIPLVMGITNGALGYALDKTTAARGGYAADTVPIIAGMLPYANIHEELVSAFLELDRMLNK